MTPKSAWMLCSFGQFETCAPLATTSFEAPQWPGLPLQLKSSHVNKMDIFSSFTQAPGLL